MLNCYRMHDCKPMDTPVKRNMSLNFDMCLETPEVKDKMSKVHWSSAFSSLMYEMMYTRPNICYVIGLIS